MRALKQQSLICFLRHHRGSCANALVCPPVEGERHCFHVIGSTEDQNLLPGTERNLFDLNRGGRLEPSNYLRHALHRCVGNGLAHDLRIRANSEEDLTAASIQKSTRLSPPRDNWPVDRLNSTVSTRRQAPERAHRFRSSL